MPLKKLVIGDLSLDLPIIQGGMGVGISGPSLAGAVSAEGGLGVIASVGLFESRTSLELYESSSKRALQSAIRKVKERNLPVGVNVMVALSNYRTLVETCVEEEVDVIISGAGLPLRLPEYVKKTGKTKIVPIVSSARAAAIICRTWVKKYDRLPDAIVVEGPKAGGHLGFKFEDLADGTAESLETLVTQTLEIVREFSEKHGKDIPLIAAGGIFTGNDIARFLKLGASGVQMATRFVATAECDASDKYKKAYINSSEDDVVVIKSPVGMPARVLRNEFIKKSQTGQKFQFSCPYKCLISCEAQSANYCIAEALFNSCRGDFVNGFAMCGENVYRVKEMTTVKALMKELKDEAESAMEQ